MLAFQLIGLALFVLFFSALVSGKNILSAAESLGGEHDSSCDPSG